MDMPETDRELFAEEICHTLPEVALFDYENVCVTPEGIVFKGLKFDEDLLIFPSHLKTYNWLYLLSSLVKRKKIKLSENETYLLVFDYWSNSIFHWMSDALPRLQAMGESAKNYIVLLPENYEYSYIHDSLKAFSFKTIFFIPLNAYVKVSTFIVTSANYTFRQN